VNHSITPKRAVRLLAAAPAALLLAAGMEMSIRLSRADLLFRENTSESVKQAVALAPANGRYQAWLAELLETEGQDSSAALDAAARLNPMDSRVWIRRGLNAELRGDGAGAERLLLHAAEIDRLMEPRWTLMNFYFRAGNEEQFWRWAKRTFEISYGDRTALFDLCWRMREDATVIAAKALPPEYPVLRQFFGFLLDQQQLEQAATIAEGILANHGKSATGGARGGPGADPTWDLPVSGQDTAAFADCVERLISAGHGTRAVRVWNAMCERGLLKHEPIGEGRLITNPRFNSFPSGAGFDWRLPEAAGVSAVKASTAGLRVTLSGTQPDAAALLTQTAPLQPGTRYRLRFHYSTTGFSGASGMRVTCGGASTPDLLSTEGREQELLFTSGEGELSLIALEYRRPLGYVRGEGVVLLRDFAMERAR